MLKLSGEALMGKLEFGTDAQEVERIARQIGIIRDRGVEVAIVVGAGNIYRGVDGAAQGPAHGVEGFAHAAGLGQEAGEPLRLNYEAGHYGPYAPNLNKVLEVMADQGLGARGEA